MAHWSSGYLEFHDTIGITDTSYESIKNVYVCDICHEAFDTKQDLDLHKIVTHPKKLPALYIKSKELGESKFIIPQKLKPSDIKLCNVNKIFINDKISDEISLVKLLVSTKSSILNVILESIDGISKKAHIEINIPNCKNILKADEVFLQLFTNYNVCRDKIDLFIEKTRKLHDVQTYIQGITDYCYAILARNNNDVIESSDYNNYETRYNRAADNLSYFSSSISNTIRGIIEFYFSNHFRAYNLVENNCIKYAIEQVLNPEFLQLTENLDEIFFPLDDISRKIISLLLRPNMMANEINDFLDTNPCLTINDKRTLHLILLKIAAYKSDIDAFRKHLPYCEFSQDAKRFVGLIINKYRINYE